MYGIFFFLGFLLFPCCVFGNTLSSNSILNTTFNTFGPCAEDWNIDCENGYTTQKTSLASISIDSTATTTNRKLSIALDLDLENPSSSALLHKKIGKLIGGKRYQLSAWVKADNFQGESMLFMTANPPTSHAAIIESKALATVQGVRAYSSWIKINLQFTAPIIEQDLYVGLLVHAQSSGCSNPECGTVHFDNIALNQLADVENNTWPFGNVCEDDEYLNLLTESCQTLDKRFGHTSEVYRPKTVYLKCGEITSNRINETIQTFGNTGGTLLLAPCKAALTDDIKLKSNVTLRGSGVGRTVLYRSKNWDSKAGTLIRLHGEKNNHVENIVLTDFSVQGSAPEPSSMNNIQIQYATNVLVERVETRNPGKSGITVKASQYVTIRYITGHGALHFHGIASKDCYIHPSLDGDDEDVLISKDECAYGYSDFYTENIAIYSNLVFNNRQYGIDSHASYSEVAGNRSFHNGYGAKFPEPANNVWIHDNEFAMSLHSGIKIALQKKLGDNTLAPHNHAIYRNLFVGNGGYGIRIHDRAYDIFLNHNEYRNNNHVDKLRIVNGNHQLPRVFICADDGSYEKAIDGKSGTYERLDRSNQQCDLNQIGNLFEN